MAACYNLKNYTIFTGIIVNRTTRPFRINIGFLINQPAGFLRDIPFEFDRLVMDDGIEFVELSGLIKLARTQNGLRSLVDFSARQMVECGRCLEEFMLPLHTEFEEIFTFHNRPLSEDEQVIPEDGNIDFEPLIRDYLLLEMPINPVCKIDCKGLCIVCGQNLNEKDCVHVTRNQNAQSSTIERNINHTYPYDEHQPSTE